MQDVLVTFRDAFADYARWLWDGIAHPSIHHWLWILLGLSAVVYALELVLPWRKQQRAIREDFWLDGFYLLFNSLLFPLLGFQAAVVTVRYVALDVLGLQQAALFDFATWPWWATALLFFAIRDFLQWNIHRLLHRVPWLWEFHKVHHSVRQMGFAAHLRFHWMENLVYKGLESLPLVLLGFSTADFLTVAVFTVAIGHLNHANLDWTYGPLRYVLNSPQMHIWHHARELPADRRYGVNFGITLSLWDWLFGTAWWPRSGRDVELGFPGDDAFPRTLGGQILYPWTSRRPVPPPSPMATARILLFATALLFVACETSSDPVNLDAGTTAVDTAAWSSAPADDAEVIAEILGVGARTGDDGAAEVVDADVALLRLSSDAAETDEPLEVEVLDLDVALAGLALAGLDYEEQAGPPKALAITLPSGRRARFVAR